MYQKTLWNWCNGAAHFFTFSLIIEGAAEKVFYNAKIVNLPQKL